jgi:galactokinase
VPHGSVVAFAPGRVNLLGEHTDYNGGLALPFAIERGVIVRSTRLPGPLCMAIARDLGEQDAFNAWGVEGASGWRAFVRGTVAECGPPPVRVEITGDVPRGGGLSSSAELGCARALALCGEDDPDRRALARLCSRVENGWVGARTGLLDQYASLLAEAGAALLIDFATDEITTVPLTLGEWRLVVVRAGRRDLAAGGYNDRRRESAEAAERLGVATLSEAAPDAHEPLARHVVSENERVRRAVTALRDGDIGALGPLLDASHASLRDDYRVSTETVERVVAGVRAAGAAGARLIGGGFGGHVLALMPPGARVPRGALEVRPAGAAHILNTP